MIREARGRPLPNIDDFTTVELRDAGGSIVEGDLEAHEGFSTMAFRPADRLAVGEYSFEIASDAGAYFEATHEMPNECPPILRTFTVTVSDDADGRQQPWPPSPRLLEEYHRSPKRTLATLVCCDETFPRFGEGQGHGCGPSTLMNDAQCAALVEVGVRKVTVSLDESLRGVSELALRVVRDGESKAPSGSNQRIIQTFTEPGCIRAEVLDLRTGDVVTEERCYDSTAGDPLGELEHDPSEALAELCEGTPYTCEVEGSAWNRDRCQPWPEPQPAGCDCKSSRGPNGDDTLAFGVLLLSLFAGRLTVRGRGGGR